TGNQTQMSALEWLRAGATGSYGTVVEPCNHLGKFPHPGILMTFYAEGETLIEAYWKSVAWPGEGVFVGEPLARPFGMRTTRDEKGWWLESHSAAGRRAVVEVAPSVVGPYRLAGTVQIPAGHGRQRLKVEAGAVRVR
ncbi:MAG: TIGR03790 family protein, partial [Methyloversatilis sp.]|nr:TIGR03790 family protein [Methyloversatilis sp.]